MCIKRPKMKSDDHFFPVWSWRTKNTLKNDHQQRYQGGLWKVQLLSTKHRAIVYRCLCVSRFANFWDIFNTLCCVSDIWESRGPYTTYSAFRMLRVPQTSTQKPNPINEKFQISICGISMLSLWKSICNLQSNVKGGKVSWIREQGQIYELLIKGEKSRGGDCGSMVTPLSFNGLIFVVHLASRRGRPVVDMTGLYINTMHVSYQMREMNKWKVQAYTA